MAELIQVCYALHHSTPPLSAKPLFLFNILLNCSLGAGGDKLASHASGLGSTPGLSTLTQATNLSGSVKCVATRNQWVTAVEDSGCKLSGVALRVKNMWLTGNTV